MPDERLGERACAVIATKPDASITFDEMITFLADQRIAKNYLPERIVVLDAMPTTPSGKIQKFKLRDLVAEPDSGDASG
jgi:cyclohexanecarboxylate-CoA ligase